MIDLMIEKYEKIAKSKYRLYLSNGEVIDTYDKVILDNNLLIKGKLNESDYNEIFKQNEIEDTYNICLKYITMRKRSIKEANDYFIRKNINNDIIPKVIKRYEDENLLNDREFTKAFINDKLKFTSMGDYKIINELKNHQISSDIIEEYSYLLSSSIIKDKIRKQIDKMIKLNHKYDSYTLRDKIYRNLVNSGFSIPLVIDTLNEYF